MGAQTKCRFSCAGAPGRGPRRLQEGGRGAHSKIPYSPGVWANLGGAADSRTKKLPSHHPHLATSRRSTCLGNGFWEGEMRLCVRRTRQGLPSSYQEAQRDEGAVPWLPGLIPTVRQKVRKSPTPGNGEGQGEGRVTADGRGLQPVSWAARMG